MRITGGSLKFKEILSEKKGTKNEHIRPTSSKVREAIFNLIAHGKFLNEIDFADNDDDDLIEGKVIADLFCGTGILGFEAFSRGAETVVFVDKNGESLRTTKKNAENLQLTDKSFFIKGDSSVLSRTPKKVNLVLMDPPYEMKLIKPTLKSLIEKDWLEKDAVIIVEHSKKEEIDDVEGYKLLDSRVYNNTEVSILLFVGK